MKKLLLLISLIIGLTECTYLGNTVKQTYYSFKQKYSPTQRVYKHMLDMDNFFVFGKIKNATAINKDHVAVVALSNRYQASEVVDVSHFSRIDSFYGLNLPKGGYQLVVVSDLDRNGFYDESEILGGRSLSLDEKELKDKVLGEFDIDLTIASSSYKDISFHIPIYKSYELAESLYYPKGTIRSLDDDIFSERMARSGMYEPAVFLEEAPMMFYAMEDDLLYKVPVVFVHGIGGSVIDFKEIILKLDRTLYKPWFFYYPSGYDLSQLSELFYKIFLSGEVIPLENMPMVIVAHSMGGLVVRDAMNRDTSKKGESKVKRLITIASPMNGHPDAKMADKGLLVIPSWRDVAPDSDFMSQLRRKKLPGGLEYHLLYSYANSSTIKLGENSDGVVPLSSQLCREAQDESIAQYGYNDTHTSILRDTDAINKIVKIIEQVKAPFPEDHMREFLKGGYNVDLGTDYSSLGKYSIRTIGRWLDALSSGIIMPLYPEQMHFVQVSHGEKSPHNYIEKDWIKFTNKYPNRR